MIGLVALLLISLTIAFVMTFLNEILNFKRRKTNSYPYECGVPLYDDSARPILKQGYYLFGLLLILFDIEAAYLFPWAVVFRKIGAYGLVEAVIFLGVLIIGFLYALKKGALKWQI
ncbi:NADH-ubiquinone/plastoquinone oxidoreductase chain 3 [Hydrogenobaculum sp. Y04AAS1]|uniref:NADH-quinone oxidoreductase subunit A n=1 Tax=Hydrogenobaculum sp. (strain Y04AAS1) TaxID=380749 RepID=UPI00015BE000|nr:NADH-ubiquinone/plastoquinone oxidoreductase chain 3 [Hydrogenobaculum sp. Y04AAS1]HCT65974.1 potassium transporter Kef [Hydrogenobaculum sp.]